MLAMILAAGFGTRLKPWTLYHPKALVEVGGRPMLGRVIEKLVSQGFDRIVVNVHHFSDQIKAYLADKEFGEEIYISDESDRILDTGGGIVRAYSLFGDGSPMLVHNVDILSNADLSALMRAHTESDNAVTLLTSSRDSSRKLCFDGEGRLRAWHNVLTGEIRPEGADVASCGREEAFSGIHVVSGKAVEEMRGIYGDDAFPVMDYLLSTVNKGSVGRLFDPDLKLIDIGKPATLSQANELF